MADDVGGGRPALLIDHIAIACRDLVATQGFYERLGLEVRYGGMHGSGATEMAVIPLADGSYVELIAPAAPERLRGNPFWSEHLLQDAGPCGWAARAADIRTPIERAQKQGIAVEGPVAGSRKRPDGQEIRWNMAFLGAHGPGADVPFFIEDVTSRELRVASPVPGTYSLELKRVDAVVLAVETLAPAIDLFRSFYQWSEPEWTEDARFGASLAFFPGTPVILSAPLPGSWLQERLAAVGPSPCAYLLEPACPPEALPASAADAPVPWCGRQVAWLRDARPLGARLGWSLPGEAESEQ